MSAHNRERRKNRRLLAIATPQTGATPPPPTYPTPWHRSVISPPRIRNQRGNPVANCEDNVIDSGGLSVVIFDESAKKRWEKELAK